MGSNGSKNIKQLLDSGDHEQFSLKVWERIVDSERYQDFKTPENLDITNLVFEGGGTKGVSYCGAIKALEDAGLLQKVTRFAGSSIGAYFAMRLCFGDSIDQIIVTILDDFRKITLDSGPLSFILNILKGFGWHQGTTLQQSLRNNVEKSTGSAETTFYQWYRKTKRELCVPIVNLTTGSVEYCHAKTTPDMSIAEAVRISMSVPIMYQPFKHTDKDGLHFLLDGGLLENYPIQAFDGWYLSMEKEDSFFHKMGSEDKPFDKMNKQTLGLLVFNAEETEFGRDIFQKRYGDELIGERPDTDLARARIKRFDKLNQRKEKTAQITESSLAFLKKLSESDLDRSGDISKDEFMVAMNAMFSDPDTRKDLVNVFGTLDVDIEAMFRDADVDNNGVLSFTECLHLLQRAGSPLRQVITSGLPSEIHGLAEYISSLFSVLDVKLREFTTKPDDVERTIGIYTDYIGTTDLEMDIEDKLYIMKQGWKAALAYLKEAANK